MNEYTERNDAGHCPYEDLAIAATLDGDSAVDAGFDLPAHVEGCDRCRDVIEQTRELDAMIASATSTDVDDATADRMLAFVAAEAEESVSQRSPARFGWYAFIGLAAALLVGLLLWAGREDAPRREDVRTETVAAAEAKIDRDLPVGANGIDAPSLPRPVEPEPTTIASAGHQNDAELVMQEGLTLPVDWVRPKPKEDIVRPLAEVLSDSAATEKVRETAERIADLFAPRPEAADRDVSVEAAAVRWIAERIDDGRIATAAAHQPVATLLSSEGDDRRVLVEAFRTTRLWRKVLGRTRVPRSRSNVGPREMQRVAVVGALGLRRYVRQLAGASAEALDRCVNEAMATGDDAAVAFALDLFLEVSMRHGRPLERAERWFGALKQSRAERLKRMVAKRLEQGGSIAMRERYAAILEILDRAAESGLLAHRDQSARPVAD